LFISVPGTADPGIMTDSPPPEEPVTNAGPRDVVTVVDGTIGWGSGAVGA
jgi:hypothetical protein